MSDDNKLVKQVKLGIANAPTPSFGLKGKLQQAQQQGNMLNTVSNAKDRIIIVADDSGSMAGEAFENQKKAIQAFLGVCNSLDTAVGVTPMNAEKIDLTLVHTVILSKVLGWSDRDLGGTPMFSTLGKAFEQNPSRVVLISDGSPMDGQALRAKEDSRMWATEYYDKNGRLNLEQFEPNPILKKYQDKKLKIDTVFVGRKDDTGAQQEMRAIADLTEGMYIFFKEGESFAKQFKYLAPAFYAQLTSGQIKI